ncbi:hypothetical protein HanRHA438_Chr10g0459581 [Helianthus annuus]|uniref:Reticulon-like protein n=1 Tax=Helianthus annuus TaxID=4232 RepID=A0A251TKN4_HELAN|nr:hypothetical protein HanXRQr2_Chr10g0447041 [Helianthus annuus]KAJ0880120.1 hypothetical protein HanRHA438_Chr10g0459581 [Helianthus annuus]
MADNVAGEHEQHEHEPSFVESVTEKISETFHKEDSSDSDGEAKKSSSISNLKDKVYRLFGRERLVHKFPEVALPEDIVLGVASAIRTEINTSLAILRNIAFGKDLKKFLAVIAGLWVLSILGSCWNFLTLLYTSFVLLHTVPYLYDRYEDKVDAYAEKAEPRSRSSMQYSMLRF